MHDAPVVLGADLAVEDDPHTPASARHSAAQRRGEEEDPSDPGDRQGIEWRQPATPRGGAPDSGGAADGGEGGGGAGQLSRDAYLVFRALCKLAIRSADAAGAGGDITATRGKVLALELVKLLLENSGPGFRGSDRFVGAVRQYLCLALLKNCAGGVPAAQRLCASIFLTLLTRFRGALKAEVGVFFPMILLRPIEPATPGAKPNAAGAGGAVAVDLGHKAVALRCLSALCGDGQLLVDLFVNYDCDLEGANLFERMVCVWGRLLWGPGLAAGCRHLCSWKGSSSA